jgi:hypothetical protein
MSDVFGRQPVTIVEIDQDFCSLVYGTSPCTAELGVTGAKKCFNTIKTCQDRANYDKTTLTLRFCKPAVNIPASWQAIPSVASVSTSPTKLNIGGISDSSGPLGTRATITIKLTDHPYSDAKTDKYVDDRNYNPEKRGTFWTKFLARSPFYQNRPLRVREGYIDQDPGDMVTRHYIIDAIDGPDSSGSVTIRGIDILRLVDDRRTKAPRLTPGELTLAINDSVTSFDVENAELSDYPATGTLRIDDEVMTYTGRTIDDGTITFTGVTRGTDSTVAAEHDIESSVQLCYRVTNEAAYTVALDLIQDFAGQVYDVVDVTEWNNEGAFWLPQFLVSALITEPTGINTLISELCQQAQFYIWWDEREQKVKLRANRPPTETPTLINEQKNILAGSQQIKVAPEERVSQVWVYYQLRTPVSDLNKEISYNRVRIRRDAEAESAEEFGDVKIRRIFSRWIKSDAVALNLATRILNKYRDNPRYLTVSLDAKDRDIWTADIVDVESRLITDDTGSIGARRFEVISAEEVKPGEIVKYVLQSADVLTGRFGFWTADDAPDYDTATEEQKLTLAFWANDSGLMPDGESGYEWQ